MIGERASEGEQTPKTTIMIPSPVGFKRKGVAVVLGWRLDEPRRAGDGPVGMSCSGDGLGDGLPNLSRVAACPTLRLRGSSNRRLESRPQVGD